MACHTLQTQRCSLTECQLPRINSWVQSLSSHGKASLVRKHSWVFFSHHVFWTNILKCVLLPAHTMEVLLPFPVTYVSIYTSFIAIFKISPWSTMSLMLFIHFPHSTTFCVQNVTYNSSTETEIQHSVGFAVINVQKFPPQKCSLQIYTCYFPVHPSEIIYKQITLLSYNPNTTKLNSVKTIHPR